FYRLRPPHRQTLFPYTTLSDLLVDLVDDRLPVDGVGDRLPHPGSTHEREPALELLVQVEVLERGACVRLDLEPGLALEVGQAIRSEEHTSELQSPCNLV